MKDYSKLGRGQPSNLPLVLAAELHVSLHAYVQRDESGEWV